jgi:hypothetical protein
MKNIFLLLFPAQADNNIRGWKLPFYIFILITLVGTVRSLIHILASDGGAGSIAGMNLAVTGAEEVVFAFALWGGEQLIYALIQWVVILRYRSLIPLMWGVQLIETLMRMLVGQLKPITFAHTPPGQVGDYIFIPLALLMLGLALWSGLKVNKYG